VVVTPAPSPAPVIVTPPPTPTPPVQIALATPTPAPIPVASPAPVPVASPATVTTTSPLPPVPVMEVDPGLALPAPGFVGPPSDRAAIPAPVFEVAPRVVEPAPAPVVVTPVEASPAAPANRLASILSGIQPEAESAPVLLPTAAEVRATQRAAARKVTAAAEATAAAQLVKDEKAKLAAAAKANPARLWVQVATGSNARGLGTTWRKIRDGNEKLLKPYGGYSVAFKSTNRVLAGPVKSSADARALVNALGKAGVSATTYNSEAGQEVVKIAGK
jgi:hypothetical protein